MPPNSYFWGILVQSCRFFFHDGRPKCGKNRIWEVCEGKRKKCLQPFLLFAFTRGCRLPTRWGEGTGGVVRVIPIRGCTCQLNYFGGWAWDAVWLGFWCRRAAPSTSEPPPQTMAGGCCRTWRGRRSPRAPPRQGALQRPVIIININYQLLLLPIIEVYWCRVS